MSVKLFRRWTSILNRIGNEDLIHLLVSREIFRKSQEAWGRVTNPDLAADLANWMANNYVAYAATAIRRIAEPPKKSWKVVSLAVLLSELATTYIPLTRKRDVSLYKDKRVREHFADQHFDQLVGRPGESSFPIDVIINDKRRLQCAVDPVKSLVDKVIAHTDEKRFRRKVLFRHLSGSVDIIAELFQKYHQLITASKPSLDVEHLIDVENDLEKNLALKTDRRLARPCRSVALASGAPAACHSRR